MDYTGINPIIVDPITGEISLDTSEVSKIDNSIQRGFNSIEEDGLEIHASQLDQETFPGDAYVKLHGAEVILSRSDIDQIHETRIEMNKFGVQISTSYEEGGIKAIAGGGEGSANVLYMNTTSDVNKSMFGTLVDNLFYGISVFFKSVILKGNVGFASGNTSSFQVPLIMPANAASGMIYFNNTTQKFMGKTAAGWVALN